MNRPLPVDPQELFEHDEQKWEHSIVQMLCTRLNVRGNVRNEIRDWARQHGRTTNLLTFAGLNMALPEFPLVMHGILLPNLVSKASVARIFRDFPGTPMLHAYADAMEETGQDQNLALVFRWPQLGKRGGPPEAMVLHDRLPDWELAGTRFTWWAGKRAKLGRKVADVPRRLTMCSLSLLVDEILTDGSGQ